MTAKAIIIMACVALVAVAGEEKEQDRDIVGPVMEGCTIALGTDRTNYAAGQPIQVDIALKNVGANDVSLLETDVMIIYKIEVRLPNGKPSPLTLEGKRQNGIASGEAYVVTLEPGNGITHTIPMLNRLYDMTLAGEYQVTVRHRRVFVQGKDTPVNVQSNTVTVKVLEEVHVANEARSKNS